MEQNTIFPRILLEKLIKYKERKEILAIVGPRQSGKTTLLKLFESELLKSGLAKDKIFFFSFEDQSVLSDFKRSPRLFIKQLVGSLSPKDRYYLFLDEFQYLKQGGQILKLLFDSCSNIKFIITGSSSLELQYKTAKFLVGRVFYFTLLPLSFEEFLRARGLKELNYYLECKNKLYKFIKQGQDFSLEPLLFEKKFEEYFNEFLIYGGYPEVVKSQEQQVKNEILKNIYNTYLQRDIISLLKITDTDTYYSLLACLSNQIGNLLNYNNLSQDTGANFSKLKHYLSVLEQTFVIERLKPFHRNLSTELRKNPMAYFIDSGLRNYLQANFDNLDKRPDKGALVENFVFSEIKKNLEEPWRLNYWRTTGKAEVDFIIRKGIKPMPIEVKYSSFNRPKVSRSLRSFIDSYKPETVLILTKDFLGETSINKTKIKFLPAWLI